jgi:hypothetical protein
MSDILKHASNKNATLKTESANTASIPTDDDEPGVKLIDYVSPSDTITHYGTTNSSSSSTKDPSNDVPPPASVLAQGKRFYWKLKEQKPSTIFYVDTGNEGPVTLHNLSVPTSTLVGVTSKATLPCNPLASIDPHFTSVWSKRCELYCSGGCYIISELLQYVRRLRHHRRLGPSTLQAGVQNEFGSQSYGA